MAKRKEDVTEEDLKLLDAFGKLKIKLPVKLEEPEDLEHYMKYYVKEVHPTSERTKTTSVPRISIFYGETDKGEVNFLTWQYEVNCLKVEGTYSEEQIFNGIRRSCKGEAANILRRLGTHVSVEDILKKFSSTYSMLETPESILRKFYACSQSLTESVSTYASRVEDIFSQAVELKALLPTQEEILKNVLYQGLRNNLRQAANYKFETVKDYDKFKVELRKIESSTNEEREKDVKTKCHAATKTEEKSELGEVKDLLKKMNARIERLEREKEEKQQQQPYYETDYQRRGYGRGLGRHDGRMFRDRGRGRGEYKPSRPTGFTNMQPTCYNCNRKGHLARNCPN